MHHILICVKFLKAFYKKIMYRSSKPIACFLAYFLFSCFLFAAEYNPAFYVDSAAKSFGANGSAAAPFNTLEQAIVAANEHINRQELSEKNGDLVPVSIFLQSNVYVEEAVFLTVPIRINGEKTPIITFGENAGFVVERTSLEIKGCVISRSERFTEPRTVPVLYGSHAAITLNGVSVTVKEGGDAVILRNSRLVCTDTSFSSDQSAQAVLIRAEKSSVSSLRSTFTASGLMALCFDFVKTESTLADTVCNLAVHYTGRFAELTDSTIQMRKVRCSYTSPLFKMMDSAILADNASKVEAQKGFQLTGFKVSLVRR